MNITSNPVVSQGVGNRLDLVDAKVNEVTGFAIVDPLCLLANPIGEIAEGEQHSLIAVLEFLSQLKAEGNGVSLIASTVAKVKGTVKSQFSKNVR